MRGEKGNLDVVRADVMQDINGRSKGCGVVEYGNLKQAEKAVRELQNSELMGRPLNLREDREPVGFGFNSSSGTPGAVKCFNCGKPGHFAKDCLAEVKKETCFNCGKNGHFARDCKLEPQSDKCFQCGGEGHFARDCPSEAPSERCFKCGEPGHMARDCSMEDDSVRCFNCGKVGHFARDCNSDPKGDKCFNCGREGHFARDCREDVQNDNCFNCGKAGHFARDCKAGTSSHRVYIGNLSWDISWQDLKDHMRGTNKSLDVLRADIMENDKGQSKGCAIVEYASARDSRRAIQEFNDTELMGRTIFVREDKEEEGFGFQSTSRRGRRERSRDRSPRRRRGGGTRQNQVYGKKVFIGNLAFKCSWQDLKDHMRTAGEVAFVTILEDRNGQSKGCGVVEFETSEDAANAIDQLNNSEIMGREIYVREYEEDEK